MLRRARRDPAPPHEPLHAIRPGARGGGRATSGGRRGTSVAGGRRKRTADEARRRRAAAAGVRNRRDARPPRRGNRPELGDGIEAPRVARAGVFGPGIRDAPSRAASDAPVVVAVPPPLFDEMDYHYDSQPSMGPASPARSRRSTPPSSAIASSAGSRRARRIEGRRRGRGRRVPGGALQSAGPSAPRPLPRGRARTPATVPSRSRPPPRGSRAPPCAYRSAPRSGVEAPLPTISARSTRTASAGRRRPRRRNRPPPPRSAASGRRRRRRASASAAEAAARASAGVTTPGASARRRSEGARASSPPVSSRAARSSPTRRLAPPLGTRGGASRISKPSSAAARRLRDGEIRRARARGARGTLVESPPPVLADVRVMRRVEGVAAPRGHTTTRSRWVR